MKDKSLLFSGNITKQVMPEKNFVTVKIFHHSQLVFHSYILFLFYWSYVTYHNNIFIAFCVYIENIIMDVSQK